MLYRVAFYFSSNRFLRLFFVVYNIDIFKIINIMCGIKFFKFIYCLFRRIYFKF